MTPDQHEHQTACRFCLSAEHRKVLEQEWLYKKLADLIDFLEEAHRELRAKTMPQTLELIQRAVERLPRAETKLRSALKTLSIFLGTDIFEHFEGEEKSLFPAIRSIEKCAEEPPGASPRCEASLGSLHKIQDQHNQILDTLFSSHLENTINRLRDVPDETCKTLGAELSRFVGDVRQHAFLEDEILFPRAVVLEQRLKSR